MSNFRPSPAFQFYPNDWLSSLHIQLMTPAEEGAYIRLLAYAWSSDDCGLPDDDQQLSVLSRLGEGWSSGASTKIRECFFSKGGRLFNERLLKERKKQDEWRKKSVEGGKKGSKSRWGKGKSDNKGGHQMVTDCLLPNDDSSVLCSLSSSSKKKEKIIKNIYGEFSNVLLTDEEHSKLISQLGEDGTKQRIENLSLYVASKGKKYSSHYATILSWERKNNGGNNRGNTSGPYRESQGKSTKYSNLGVTIDIDTGKVTEKGKV